MRAPLLTGMGLGCAIVLGSWVLVQMIPLPKQLPSLTKPRPQFSQTPRHNSTEPPPLVEHISISRSTPLPSEAIPTPSDISPPESEWQNLRRQKNAVAY